MSVPLISFSVVSYGQRLLVEQLLDDLSQFRRLHDIELIVTSNIPERGAWQGLDSTDPRTRLIENATPLGFGANHNQAFAASSGEYFCIVNPDIRMPRDPFPVLLDASALTGGALVSPAVLAPDGEVEDHARAFPTIAGLVRRRFGQEDGAVRYHPGVAHPPIAVDWLAGMFLLLPRSLFAKVGGFDDRFFMYCEDIDLSARIWRAGRPVLVCPDSAVIHDARRATRRSRRHLRWHLVSMMRLFAKWPGGFPRRTGWPG